jgi:hypothetical protein
VQLTSREATAVSATRQRTSAPNLTPSERETVSQLTHTEKAQKLERGEDLETERKAEHISKRWRSTVGSRGDTAGKIMSGDCMKV